MTEQPMWETRMVTETWRDEIAMQAMEALIKSGITDPTTIAKKSYRIADAMLAEANQKDA